MEHIITLTYAEVKKLVPLAIKSMHDECYVAYNRLARYTFYLCNAPSESESRFGNYRSDISYTIPGYEGYKLYCEPPKSIENDFFIWTGEGWE